MAKGLVHPSKNLYLVATVLVLISFVFAVVAANMPTWSRIHGKYDDATTNQIVPTLPYLTYASTNVGQDSTLYLGHWEWCLDYGDHMDTYTCGMTRSLSVPTFGNNKCIGFFYASRILHIIATVWFFLAFLAAAALFVIVGKWAPGVFWKPPTAVGFALFGTLVLGVGCEVAAFASWIIVAETSCRTDTTIVNPFKGYSTSFILAVFAAGLGFLAMLAACLAMLKLKKIPQYLSEPPKEVLYMEEQPAYPVTYDVGPGAYAATQVLPSTPVY